MNFRNWSLQIVLAISLILVGSPVHAQSPLPRITPEFNCAIPSTMDTFSIPEMANNTDSIVVRDIDLGPTIAGFAEIEKLSIEHARLETLLFLGMKPRIQAADWVGQGPTFRGIDGERYRITAPQSFFDALPAMMLCLELGKKQVSINCQMITITQKQSKRLNAFITPGTAEVYCAKMPEVVPVTTAKPLSSSDKLDANTFISSSTIVRKNTPVTTGTISKENRGKLYDYLKATNTTTNFAPNIVAFPGQLATISNASKRPFVIGLEAIHGEFTRIGTQPVVQAIEEGVMVRLRAIPRDGKIQLFSDIALSDVGEIQTLTFASSGEQNQQVIQVPEQRLRQIHFSTLVDEDSAILIDPNFSIDVKAFNSKGPFEHKCIFILQAKMIDMD